LLSGGEGGDLFRIYLPGSRKKRKSGKKRKGKPDSYPRREGAATLRRVTYFRDEGKSFRKQWEKTGLKESKEPSEPPLSKQIR